MNFRDKALDCVAKFHATDIGDSRLEIRCNLPYAGDDVCSLGVRVDDTDFENFANGEGIL